jgi:hypothetical protein
MALVGFHLDIAFALESSNKCTWYHHFSLGQWSATTGGRLWSLNLAQLVEIESEDLAVVWRTVPSVWDGFLAAKSVDPKTQRTVTTHLYSFHQVCNVVFLIL